MSVESVVVIKQIVRPRSVGIDNQRLLPVIVEEESESRLVVGFHDYVLSFVPRSTNINDSSLSLMYEPRLRVACPYERDPWLL
jgi:hypothetical protein